jgi:dihydrofolate reductase
MMESYWPAVARGDAEAPPAMREWAVKLVAKPKYVVSSTRKDFPWTNSHHVAGDLRTGVQKLKDATPDGVLLGSGKLATALDRLDLIDEYQLLVHPRIAGHGPKLYESGLPSTRRPSGQQRACVADGTPHMRPRRASPSWALDARFSGRGRCGTIWARRRRVACDSSRKRCARSRRVRVCSCGRSCTRRHLVS